MSLPFISIVVPVYNEEDSLPHLHVAVTSAMSALSGAEWELILVDDGSTDGSARVLRDLYDSDRDHVRLVSLRRNYGQSSAMGAGFDAAVGDVIVPMDADLQNDPTDIGRLVGKMDEGFDVVSGWRKDRQDAAISRKLPSRIANGLISWITGVRLNDYGCSLKAYRADIAKDIRLYGEMHRFLPALAYWNGAHVTELPVKHHARQFGKSKYGISRTITVLLDLMTVKFLLSYATRPMQFFGKWGIFVGLLALLTGGIMIYQKVGPQHQDLTDSPLLYLTMLFALGSTQLLGLGLISEINVRTYFESQDKRVYAVRERLLGTRAQGDITEGTARSLRSEPLREVAEALPDG